MASRNWYLAVGSRRLGPYESGQIPDLVRDGTLRHQTLVWNEDLDGWMAAREVPEMMLYLRGVPESSPAPAAVSAEVLSSLIDQVTSEVSSEVLSNVDAYTRESAVTKSGRHVAVDAKAADEAPRKAEPVPASAAAPGPAKVPAAVSAPVDAKPPEPAARPSAPGPVPVPAVPAAATPAGAASPPRSAVPAAPAKPAAPVHPFGAMPPDPFASRSRAVPARAAGATEVPADFIRLIGKILKGAGCIGILVGVICVLFAIDRSSGGPMQRIAWFGIFSMPLVVGLGLFGFGLFLDLWLEQAERLREALEAAKRNASAGA